MKEILLRLLNKEVLSREETREILINIASEKYNDVQIAALLTAIQMRGITVEELLGFRDGILETGVPALLDAPRYLDIVGTGGDQKNTFNISTCACLVVAGAGYKVVKHGNKAATSVSGASDVIAAHGVKFTNDLDILNRSLEKSNFAYLHAPLFAKAMKFVAPVRKQIEFPTLFNLLGPLVNPSQPKCNMMGVADLDQMRLYNSVFQKMGVDYAIVHSIDGYDEISLTGILKVTTNNYEKIFHPFDFGQKKVDPAELVGGATETEAVKIFDNVLNNVSTEGQKNVVLTNAAVGIQILDPDNSIEEAFNIAKESLESGRALATFKKFIEVNS